MSSIQTQTTSFKAECWQAVHNLLSDTLNIALYTSDASLNENTTVYLPDNEIVANGYIAGGQAMSGATINSSGYIVYANFNNPVWTAAITARYALIYNVSKANRSVAVLDFGADKTSTTTFTVTLPANTATTALLRSSN
jgi:hypothetical protein